MPVSFRAVILGETQRACRVDYNGEEMWLPKSQILAIDGRRDVVRLLLSRDNEHRQFEISNWLAREKGITLAEERYTVEGRHVRDMTIFPEERGTLCYALSDEYAQKIAAALNLTEGKR